MVLIGAYVNTPHADRAKIGTLNWQWWELEKSKEEEKRLIGVRLESWKETPTPLLNAGAAWASYSVDSILRALREA